MSIAFALLLAAAQPAQQAQPPAQPQSVEVPLSADIGTAMTAASEALARCLDAGMARVPATSTPEVGGVAVEAGCTAEIQRIAQIATQMINSDARTSAQQKSGAIMQLQASLAGIDIQIAEGIRQQRAGAPQN